MLMKWKEKWIIRLIQTSVFSPGVDDRFQLRCLAFTGGTDAQSSVDLTVGFLSPQFHFNPAQSILVMESEDLENMNAAVRKVSYINSRQFPTPGARRLRISTSVQ